MRLRVMRLAAWLFLLALWVVPASAEPDFPELSGRVVDEAHLLSDSGRQQLTQLLSALEDETDKQLVVVTLPDLGSTSIEDYGYQLGRHWGIGQKDRDNGALLIIAREQHAIRIEVGYGLEGELTDAKSALIIRRIIAPAFKKGNFEQGILQGTAAIAKVLGSQSSEMDEQLNKADHGQRDDGPSISHVIFFVILMIAIIALFGGGGGPGGRRRRGLPFGIPIGGGLGSGPGGGFSGGGGSFGGGGASGGW